MRLPAFFVTLVVTSLVACGKDTPRPPATPVVATPATAGALEPANAPEPAGDPANAPAPAGDPADDPEPTGEPANDPEPTGEPANDPEPTGEPANVGADGVALVFAAEDRMPAADCDALVAKEFALVAETGSDEMKEGAAKTGQAEALAKCRAAPHPRVVADCIRGVTSANEMFRSCYTLPFQGRDLVINRQFTANDPANQSADPPMFTQHGDIIMIRANCGLLLQKLETFLGAFLQCDGKTQGPFTTGADIKEVFAAMSAEQAASHRMMMGIMANYPSGRSGGNWRVCNTAGVCHIE